MDVLKPETWLDLGLHPDLLGNPDWQESLNVADPNTALRAVRMVAVELRSLLPEMETKLTVFDGLDWMVDVDGYGVDGDFGHCVDDTIWTRIYADDRESLVLDEVPVETAAGKICAYIQSGQRAE